MSVNGLHSPWSGERYECLVYGWNLAPHKLCSHEGKSSDNSHSGHGRARGQSRVRGGLPLAEAPQGSLLDHLLSLVFRTFDIYTSWKAPGTMNGWKLCF